MKTFITRLSTWIEDGVVAFCDLVYRRPIVSALILAALVALPVAQMPQLKRDGSIEGFLKADDPALHAYNGFRHQFGQDGEIIIGIASPEIFSLAFLEKLADLHRQLERNVPYLEDITSLYNARDVKGNDQDFVVEDLLLHWPKNDADLQALKSKVMSNQVYRDLLISSDGSFTTITIKPDRYTSERQNRNMLDNFATVDPGTLARDNDRRAFLTARETGEMVAAVHKVTAAYDADDFRIYVSGSPTASSTIVQLLTGDMSKYMLASVGIVLVLLVAFTRRPVSALIAALVVALTTFTTFGLMAANKVAIKPPTQVLLSIILVASICELVHIVTMFFQKLESLRDKESALRETVRRTAIPVLFTSLTTAAGLIAFCSSDLAPIADLGWYGAFAVGAAMVFTWLVVVLCVRLLPIKAKDAVRARARMGQDEEKSYRWAVALAMFANRRPVLVLGCAAPLLAGILFGISKVGFSHNSLLWLPETNQTRVATEKLDSVLHGSVNLELVVKTPGQQGVQDKAFLEKLDALTVEIQQLDRPGLQVGKATAVTDILKEVNQGLHAGDRAHYTLAGQDLLEQEFVLFENSSSNDLPYIVDTGYGSTRFTVRVPWLEASHYASFITEVEDLFRDKLGPDYQVTATGVMTLIARTSTAVMQSLKASYVNSMILMPIMMILLLGSFRMGLVSMIPNVLPVAMVIGIMGYMGIPLDTFSMLVGSIALGLIVDDSVHFFHNFSHLYRKCQDSAEAIRLTIEQVGRPIVNTSVILASAFGSYMLAAMHNVRDFGFVMVVTIVIALFFDLLLTPALLTLMYKSSKARVARTQESKYA